ncbi:MAG TPA: hypothetical protein VH044_02920 [Polyangiaceae bacterium]|nr:hypothetical protein [Polyangiaceae bacterium]
MLLCTAPGFTSGCGSSSAQPPAQSNPGDASITYTTVVTAGGGAPNSGSSSGSIGINPFGDIDSGSGSSTGSSTGSTDDGAAPGDDGSTGDDSATTSDTGAPPGDAGPDSGDASTPPANVCVNYVAPVCGSGPCDLRTHTCCVTLSLAFTCVAGTGSSACPSNQASVHCLQSCECGGTKSCCGVENTLIGAVTAECQEVPNGGFCSPHPQTSTEASAQFCKTDAECKNGQGCIAQTCEFNAVFNICGVQSQAPFDCKAN